MEFIGGVIFTLIAVYVGSRVYKTQQRKKESRERYIPPSKQR